MRKSAGFERKILAALGLASLMILAVLANAQSIPRAAASTPNCNIPDTGGVNLQGADLEHCNLAGYDMQGDNLSGANLYGTNLQNANLQGANLQNADLETANVQGTSFQGANLSGAKLQGDNLSGDNLQGANLHGADAHNAILAVANLSGANLQGANLLNADFADANLSGANLSGANLSRAIFAGANTSGCNGCLNPMVPATENTNAFTSNVTAPNKEELPPACVHVVPNNAIVSANGTVVVPGVMRENIQLACSQKTIPPATNGYVVDGNDLLSTSSNSINELIAYWTVPPNPTTCSSSSDQILFFWNGLEDNGNDTYGVLWQPVLSHGYNGGSYGCYYYINVWFLDNGNSMITPGFTVYPGDTIFAELYYEGTVGGTCCYWYGEIADQTSGHLGVESEQGQTGPGTYYQMYWAFGGVLEVANVNSCSEYPNGSSGYTEFYNILMYDSTWTAVSPSWTSFVTSQTPGCNFGTSYPSNGSYLYLYY